MGYTTNFNGNLTISPPLSLKDYNEYKDHLFFKIQHQTKGYGYKGFPDTYNQWEVSFNGDSLAWDGNEKFYDYIEWMKWLALNFFQAKGYTLNGIISWQGEESEDMGRILVTNNLVKAQQLDYKKLITISEVWIDLD